MIPCTSENLGMEATSPGFTLLKAVYGSVAHEQIDSSLSVPDLPPPATEGSGRWSQWWVVTEDPGRWATANPPAWPQSGQMPGAW